MKKKSCVLFFPLFGVAETVDICDACLLFRDFKKKICKKGSCIVFSPHWIEI